jgi:hypothetical protein
MVNNVARTGAIARARGAEWVGWKVGARAAMKTSAAVKGAKRRGTYHLGCSKERMKDRR